MSIALLPFELYVHIFQFLNPQDAQAALRVCRLWHGLVLESQCVKARAFGRLLSERLNVTLPALQVPSLFKIQEFYLQCRLIGIAALIRKPNASGVYYEDLRQTALGLRAQAILHHAPNHPQHIDTALLLLSKPALQRHQPQIALEIAMQITSLSHRNTLLEQITNHQIQHGTLSTARGIAELLPAVQRDHLIRLICIAHVARNEISEACELTAHLVFDYNQYLALNCIYEALRESALNDPVIFGQALNILRQMPPGYRASMQCSFTRYLFAQGHFCLAMRSLIARL